MGAVTGAATACFGREGGQVADIVGTARIGVSPSVVHSVLSRFFSISRFRVRVRV